MPELPEVETVKETLKRLVLHKTILSCETYYDKYKHLEILKNETINDITRYGKYLIFHLDNYYLISHLRMEGKYFLKETKEKDKHDHVLFTLNDSYLYYNDVRKFGVFNLFKKDIDIFKEEPLNKLGLEPFNATKEYLYNKIQTSTQVKTLLLDQSILTGLGNIYVDEVLFLSHINPLRMGKDIKMYECENIIKASIKTLNKAIEAGGTTIRSFSAGGIHGLFQNELLVHERKGNCINCGCQIEKIKVGGRGTYFCPTCQNINKKTLVAITGGFASGKSYVLNKFKQLGYKTLNLDDITNEIYDSSIIDQELINEFNTKNKKEISKIVFNDSEKLNKLNSIIHPLIKKKMYNKIEDINEKIIFIEVPLLFETDFKNLFDYIILSYCDKDTQIKRGMERDNISKEEALKRINSQMDLSLKIEMSDYVIKSDEDYLEIIKILEV